MSEKRVGVAILSHRVIAISLVDRAVSPETYAVAALRSMTYCLYTAASLYLLTLTHPLADLSTYYLLLAMAAIV